MRRTLFAEILESNYFDIATNIIGNKSTILEKFFKQGLAVKFSLSIIINEYCISRYFLITKKFNMTFLFSIETHMANTRIWKSTIHDPAPCQNFHTGYLIKCNYIT